MAGAAPPEPEHRRTRGRGGALRGHASNQYQRQEFVTRRSLALVFQCAGLRFVVLGNRWGRSLETAPVRPAAGRFSVSTTSERLPPPGPCKALDAAFPRLSVLSFYRGGGAKSCRYLSADRSGKNPHDAGVP